MSRWSRYRTSAAMAATVALGLAGCGSTTHGSVPTTSAPPRSTTTAPVPTPSFSTGCTTVELTLSITGPVGTAGAEHYSWFSTTPHLQPALCTATRASRSSTAPAPR